MKTRGRKARPERMPRKTHKTYGLSTSRPVIWCERCEAYTTYDQADPDHRCASCGLI